MYATTITKSGQMTLTRPAREYLGVAPGDKVMVFFRNGRLNVERRMTDAEFFEQLDARNTPETKAAMKRNAGKSISEMRADWAKSPAGQKYFEEKYGQ